MARSRTTPDAPVTIKHGALLWLGLFGTLVLPALVQARLGWFGLPVAASLAGTMLVAVLAGLQRLPPIIPTQQQRERLTRRQLLHEWRSWHLQAVLPLTLIAIIQRVWGDDGSMIAWFVFLNWALWLRKPIIAWIKRMFDRWRATSAI